MDQPKTIARYRLTGELGRGGMGVVYRAEDPQLGRPVAIKVILFPSEATAHARAQLERRFEREARSAASIRHPGVVTVHDFGRDGDYLYLVMELVAGVSLADRLKAGWLPERAEAFEIVAQIADGLAAAHDAGVVHRDVTPRNILLASDGNSPGERRVVVTDFGIARSIGEETYELTQTGMLVGSPSFMAPEQVRNQAVDERADIFSLGVVLYLLLIGKLPFRSQDLTSLLYQIVHEDPFESSEVTGKLGAATVDFLKRCLAKEPADRVRKAGDFARQARRLRAAAQTSELEETVALEALGGPVEGPGAGGKRAVLALALIATLAVGAWALYSLFGSGRAPESAGTVASARSAPVASPAIDEPSDEDQRSQTPASSAPDSSDQESEPTPEPGRPVASEAARQMLEQPPVSPPEPLPTSAKSALQPEAQPARPASAEVPSTDATESSPEDLEASASAEPVTVPPTDTVPPVLDIDDMPRELTATDVVLSGRVMDDSRGAVALTVDGDPVAVASDGGFVARRPLSPGRNSLAFVAVDAAGNPTMKSVDVTAPGSVPAAVSSTAAGPVGTAGGVRPGRPRFGDRGDGTVVDTLTGITWSKRIEPSPVWKASKLYCKKLELGSYRDWVLPTIDELEELYRSGAGALTFPDGLIWSSTKNGVGKAWAFNFARGQREARPVAGTEGSELRAFCLRRPRPRFTTRDLESPISSGGSQPIPGSATQPPPRGGGGGGRGGGGGGGGGGG